MPRSKRFLSRNKKKKVRSFKQINLEYQENSLKNEVNTKAFSLFSLLPKTLYSLSNSLSFIWYIFLISIHLSPYCPNISTKFAVILPFCLLFLSRLLFSSLLLCRQYSHDKILNNRMYPVFNENQFVLTQSFSLVPGDIILINTGQSVPADGILLAFDSDCHEIFVRDSKSSQELSKKKALKITQVMITETGIDVAEIAKSLEFVQVTPPSSLYSKFIGKVKVKDNPRISKASIDNFIQSGSEIIECEWVLILLIYVGMETKTWSSYLPRSNLSQSKHKSLISSYFLTSFFLLSLLVLLHSIFSSLETSEQIPSSTPIKILSSIMLYGNMFPISLYLSTSLLTLIQTLFLNKLNPNFKIFNPKSLENLGKIDYILTEKTGVLVQSPIQVQVCVIGETFYQLSQNKDESVELNEVHDFISSDKLEPVHVQSFDKLQNEVISEECSREMKLFIVCLAICNTFVCHSSNKVSNLVDEAILEFAASLKVKIHEKSDKHFLVGINNIGFSYSISVNKADFSQTRRENGKLNMIVKDHQSGEVFIIIRIGEECFGEECFGEEDFEDIENFQMKYLKSSEFSGLRKVVFLFKEIKEDEYLSFKKEYSLALNCKVNRYRLISNIFDTYKSNSKFLGALGYGSQHSNSVQSSVQTLIHSNTKLWITTHESHSSALSTCYELNLANENLSLINLKNCTSPSELNKIIIDSLNKETSDWTAVGNKSSKKRIEQEFRAPEAYEISRSKSLFLVNSNLENRLAEINLAELQNFRFTLAFGSKILKKAFKNRDLMKFLVVLMVTAKAVVVSELEPEMKRRLVSLIKENVATHPVILTIGSNEIDRMMINEAHVGVMITHDFTGNSFADIYMKSFCDVENLILNHGKNWIQKATFIVILMSFKGVCIGMLMFWFNLESQFSSNPGMSFELWLIFELIISFFYITIIGLVTNPNDLLSVQIDYIINTSQKFKKFILLYLHILCGFFQGSILYIFIRFSNLSILNSSGKTEDFETQSATIFILITITLFSYTFAMVKEKLKTLVISLSMSFVTLIFVIISCNSKLGYYYLAGSSFGERPTIWCLFLIFSIISYYISYAFLFISGKIVPKSMPKINIDKIFTNKVQWSIPEKHEDFEIDKKSLQFKDEFKEKEYLQLLFKTSSKFLKVFLIIVLILEIINNVFIFTNIQGYLDLGMFTIIITVASLLYVFVSFWVKFNYFIAFELSVFLLLIAFSLAETLLNTSSITFQRYPIFLSLFSVIICTGWKWSIFKAIFIYLISIPVIVYESHNNNPNDLTVNVSHWIITMLCITLLILIINYSQEKNRRTEFTLIKKAEIEVEKSLNILAYLLPQFVRKRVKDGIRYIAEDKGTVSVIFCDIHNFERIIDLYSPSELTDLLNLTFDRIDRICESFGVTKIETVGKTYLACAGLKDSESGIDSSIRNVPHSRRAVEMALAIIKESERIWLKDGSHIKFKIGVNSGPVTAGVVGFHKPQFSLVGDTVNTASRMASTLVEINAVQISMSTYDLMQDHHGLCYTDCVQEVKGKGKMETKIVQLIEAKTDDLYSDESHFLFFKRRSIPLNSLSSPHFLQLSKVSDNLASKSHTKQSTLLSNLGVNNTKELLNRQTTQKVYNFFLFICKETKAERMFRVRYLEETWIRQKYGMVVSGICNLLLIIAESTYLALDFKAASLSRLCIVILHELLLVLSLYLRPKYGKSPVFALCLSILFCLSFIAMYVSEFISNFTLNLTYMYFSYHFLQLNFFTGTIFSKNLIPNLIQTSIWLSFTFTHSLSLPHISYTLTFISIILFTVFSDEKRMRLNSVLKSAAEKEIEKTSLLLSQMMPPHALANLEEGKQVMDRLNQVTIMFADIVGFTAWSSVRSPSEVVGMLSELFTSFDHICVENDVYKVHTIGDCYVAMGYVNDNNRNPAKEAVNLINFASSIIGEIEKTNLKCGIELGMRIGVHTGMITAGIIGTKIVRYDIYGTDVFIANKMESNGEAGKIAVSEETKEILESYLPGVYRFVEGKEVAIPQVDKSVKLYFLEVND